MLMAYREAPASNHKMSLASGQSGGPASAQEDQKTGVKILKMCRESKQEVNLFEIIPTGDGFEQPAFKWSRDGGVRKLNVCQYLFLSLAHQHISTSPSSSRAAASSSSSSSVTEALIDPARRLRGPSSSSAGYEHEAAALHRFLN